MKRQTDYLYGTSSVIMALLSKKRPIQKLFLKESFIHSADQTLATNLAKNMDIPIQIASTSQLDKLSGSRPNNGLVLQTGKFNLDYCSDLGLCKRNENSGKMAFNLIYNGKKERQIETIHNCPLVMFLDKIEDPQNLGTIIRTSHFFAIDAIVMTESNSSPITASVSKSSAGSLETGNPPILLAKSMSKIISSAKKNGWNVFGTNLKGDNVVLIEPFSPPLNLLNAPTILLLGNEGKGIRSSLSNLCDKNLIISSARNDKNQQYSVESLNVSLAAGILLNHIIQSQSN